MSVCRRNQTIVNSHSISLQKATSSYINSMEDQKETFEVKVVVNDEQLEAITKHVASNVQVIAGPGTGK